MRDETQEKIIELARTINGYLRVKDLKEKHISPKHLVELVKNGVLEKVSHGLYRLVDLEWEGYESFVEISKRIPKGVICCDSALEYYQLSTINPGQIHVAVNANSNITKPDYPPVQLYYLSKNQFEIGINEITIRGEKIRIYSPEKTICDCVKFRNRIGMEVVLESIKNYVKRRD